MNALLTALLTALLAPSGTAQFDAQMAPLATEYLKIHDALANDSSEGVAEAAKALAVAAPKLDPKTVTGDHAAHYADLPSKIEAAAKTMAAAEGLEAQRQALKALSQPFAMWVTMSRPKGLDVVFCSMAKGSWIQKAGPVRNPYYGASMLACGEVVGGENLGKKSGRAADEH